MTDKMGKNVAEISELEDQAKDAKAFACKLQCQPDVHQNKFLDLDEVLQMTGPNSDFISQTWLPKIFWAAMLEDEWIEAAAANPDILHRVGGFGLLKHAHFALKTAEDACKSKKTSHQNIQKRYAKHTEGMRSRLDKKRKAAQLECDKLLVQDPTDKEIKLARRNQINRKRRKIPDDKIKKVRSEENLPQALSFLAVCGGFRF